LIGLLEDKEEKRQQEELMDFVLEQNKGAVKEFFKRNNVKI
jgi:hypothetical protein